MAISYRPSRRDTSPLFSPCPPIPSGRHGRACDMSWDERPVVETQHMQNGTTSSAEPYPETADIETSSDDYASRFSGPAGEWMLEVQERITLGLLGDNPAAGILTRGVGVPAASPGRTPGLLHSREDRSPDPQAILSILASRDKPHVWLSALPTEREERLGSARGSKRQREEGQALRSEPGVGRGLCVVGGRRVRAEGPAARRGQDEEGRSRIWPKQGWEESILTVRRLVHSNSMSLISVSWRQARVSRRSTPLTSSCPRVCATCIMMW